MKTYLQRTVLPLKCHVVINQPRKKRDEAYSVSIFNNNLERNSLTLKRQRSEKKTKKKKGGGGLTLKVKVHNYYCS